MKIQCPRCGRTVPAEQVNISKDLALCAACNESFRLSENLEMASMRETLRRPPKGTWFVRDIDRTVVGASTRSPLAFFLIPFMCVWSGFSLFGIYGRQFISGEFNIVPSLFGVPFILGTIIMGIQALMSICGKVEVSIGSRSSVFVGIWRLGWTRDFDWDAIQTIREEQHGSAQGKLLLQGKERVTFGRELNEQRKLFVLNALRCLRAETRFPPR